MSDRRLRVVRSSRLIVRLRGSWLPRIDWLGRFRVPDWDRVVNWLGLVTVLRNCRPTAVVFGVGNKVG